MAHNHERMRGYSTRSAQYELWYCVTLVNWTQQATLVNFVLHVCLGYTGRLSCAKTQNQVPFRSVLRWLSWAKIVSRTLSRVSPKNNYTLHCHSTVWLFVGFLVSSEDNGAVKKPASTGYSTQSSVIFDLWCFISPGDLIQWPFHALRRLIEVLCRP